VEKKFIFAPLKEKAFLHMAKKQKQDDEVLVDVGQSISNAEKFIEENQKTIYGVIIAIVAIVGGYFAYTKLYQEPREQEAQEAIFYAQQSMEQDSLRAAINGANGNMGFLDLADEYSGTKAANMANYYAGIAYLNLGEFENAIEYLDKFSSNDPVLSVIAKGAIGDAFLELEQADDALEYYQSAVRGKENNFVVPIYLQKAGMLAEDLGKLEDAMSSFERIKDEFPSSPEAVSAAKYIARIEAQMAK
jgi:tetratricopeptide (TPR) repeat protein